MHKKFSLVAIAAAALMLGAFAEDGDEHHEDSSIRHVLLISIDGMHALDFKNCSVVFVRHCGASDDAIGAIQDQNCCK